MKQFTIEQALAMLLTMPRMSAKGGRAWHTNVKTVAYVACALITAESTQKAIEEVSRKANVASKALHCFIRGQTTQGAKWPELRATMTAYGVAWHVSPRERRESDADKASADARAAAPPKDQTTSPRKWRIDPETQDILVTTTTRYAYGSAEHRTNLVQLAHSLGTAAPASAAK